MDSPRMTDQDRDDTGRYTAKVTLDEILNQFNREPLTATEIADHFDISNRAALNKLEELHERGDLERKEAGARAVVWWKD